MNDSKRVGIPHVSKEFEGAKVSRASIKFDGAALRIGKTTNNTPFIETARSGIIVDPMEFESYSRMKGFVGVRQQRTTEYGRLFRNLLDSGIYDRIDSGTKLFLEVLHRPFATLETRDLIHYVTIGYPREIYGRKQTHLVLLNDESLFYLRGFSTDQIGTIDPHLPFHFCLSWEELLDRHPSLENHEGVVYDTDRGLCKLINPRFRDLRKFRG